MGERTAIAWCDATFNPWWICTEVSPACDHCYARRLAARFGYAWGKDVPRREFGEKHWNDPLRWARSLPAKLGRRPRVFCSSMADVFDNEAPRGARERLWEVIASTPQLDWLLLTKRIGNAQRMLPADWSRETTRYGARYSHVWLGATVVNQAEADRDVPKLLSIPARIRWLSVEPMLEPIDLEPFLYPAVWESGRAVAGRDFGHGTFVSWIVVGGESGPTARPLEASWCVDVRDQCARADAPFFFKQGSAANWPDFGNYESFPRELRVREFPR